MLDLFTIPTKIFKMKKIWIFFFALISSFGAFAQANISWAEALKTKTARVDVAYLSNPPFFYQNEEGKLAGIEYDLLQAFADWAKKEKGVTIEYRYFDLPSFDLVFNRITGGKNALIGAATVSINEKRSKFVNFSAPYLRNRSMLITSGEVPSMVYSSEIKAAFANLQAVTIQGSVHEKALEALKKETLKDLRVTYLNNPDDILKVISSDPTFFGYVDAVTYWSYLQKNKDAFLKIQRTGEMGEEYFGFIFPKKSDWNLAFSTFFDSGFGFTATKNYLKILETHLGPEIIETVRIKGTE
jgi:ABC-type amino acid transport substrate-binding protein